MNFAKLKLLGAHPRYITAEELKLNPNIRQNLTAGSKHVLGDSGADKDLRLSVEGQVKALIDHATDANLLGRIYIGWEPFV